MRQTSDADALETLIALRNRAANPGDDDQLRFLNFCLANLLASHSQFLQDLWAAYELRAPRDGFFVEFGGADGLRASNSLYFERELGWRGIVAEPARAWYPALRRNRGCFVDDRCVWSRSDETLTFNQPATLLHATLDSFSDADGHAESRRDGERYPVTTVSLLDLLRTWDAPRSIDYLSIDTEGSEFDILQAFDFGAYDVRLITVEHNHTARRQDIFDLLTARGFRRKFEALSNVDDWYAKAY